MDEAGDRGALRLRPTPFGLSSVAVAGVALASRGSTDAALAGLAWVWLVAVVLIGVLWPLATIGRLRLRLDPPPDLTQHATALVGVDATVPGLAGTVGLRLGDLDDPDAPGHALDPGRSELRVVPRRRGVWRSLTVDVWSDGPLGVAVVTRTLVVALDREVAVGPGVTAGPEAPADDVAPTTGEVGGAVVHGGDQVRSVRPYRSGDPSHLVHWASTARTGALVVRELEPPARARVVVDVDLDGRDPDADDEACRRAAGRALAALRRGHDVVLRTHDAHGPRATPVTSARQVQRTLAAAVPGSRA